MILEDICPQKGVNVRINVPLPKCTLERLFVSTSGDRQMEWQASTENKRLAQTGVPRRLLFPKTEKPLLQPRHVCSIGKNRAGWARCGAVRRVTHGQRAMDGCAEVSLIWACARRFPPVSCRLACVS
jgi:hypothetical protein